MKKLKKTSILLIIFASSFSATAQTFTITGTTTGLDDGTWLYLRTSSPEKTLDSTKILAGKFILKGKTEEKISQLGIYTAKYKNYIFFWAEQRTHLTLKDGEFKKAIITGSKTQVQSDLRYKLKEPNQRLQDSLTLLFVKEKDIASKKDLQEKLNLAREEGKELAINDVKTYPNSILSAYILSVYSSTWGKEKSTELFNNLSTEIKNTTYGKRIKAFISLNQEIKIGGKYADFSRKILLAKVSGSQT